LERFLDSLTSINWKTTRLEASKSGDMAYLVGTYEMTMKDGINDRGKYCEVWKKKADGKWPAAATSPCPERPGRGRNR
jgi:ketosteroid isomerase-like protein